MMEVPLYSPPGGDHAPMEWTFAVSEEENESEDGEILAPMSENERGLFERLQGHPLARPAIVPLPPAPALMPPVDPERARRDEYLERLPTFARDTIRQIFQCYGPARPEDIYSKEAYESVTKAGPNKGNIKKHSPAFYVLAKENVEDIIDDAATARYKSMVYAHEKHGWDTSYLNFEFPQAFLVEFIQRPCGHCGRPSTQNHLAHKMYFKSTAGITFNVCYPVNCLDRINSGLPYLRTNIMPSCFTCNLMKNDLPLEYFYHNCMRIVWEQERKKIEEREKNLYGPKLHQDQIREQYARTIQ